MRVQYDEGLASHIDPKPCVVVREGIGEASVGESIGQPLSRESAFEMPTRLSTWKAKHRAASAQVVR